MNRVLIAMALMVPMAASSAPLTEGLYCTTIPPFADIIEWRLTREGCCPGVYSLRGREVTGNVAASGTVVTRDGRAQVGWTLYPRDGDRPVIGGADLPHGNGALLPGEGIFYVGSSFGRYEMRFRPIPSGGRCE